MLYSNAKAIHLPCLCYLDALCHLTHLFEVGSLILVILTSISFPGTQCLDNSELYKALSQLTQSMDLFNLQGMSMVTFVCWLGSTHEVIYWYVTTSVCVKYLSWFLAWSSGREKVERYLQMRIRVFESTKCSNYEIYN